MLTILQIRIFTSSSTSYIIQMKKTSTVERLLKNMGNMHELGRQRAFELGNPFYAQFEEYGKYWCKELPTGEKYLVEIEIINDANGIPKEIKDTVIKKLN
ncbi:hypothetical protein N824_21210 [Pedobacter sp. V48]|nr:hypothetical protein N824_21210 [Pedobacter sp. V48]